MSRWLSKHLSRRESALVVPERHAKNREPQSERVDHKIDMACEPAKCAKIAPL